MPTPAEPADDFDAYALSLIRGFAFGLAGASLVIICQFITDQRINPWAMGGVIASMPFLALTGLMSEVVVGSYRKHEGKLALTVLLTFALALSINLMSIAAVFGSIRKVFAVAFGVGAGLGYCALAVLFRVAKKGD